MQPDRAYFAGLHSALESLYNSIESPLSIVNYPLSIDNSMPPFDDSFYDAVINELYGNGGYSPDYLTTPNGSALIGETNRVLMDAVTKGVSSITEEPDPAFSAALAQNTFIFSGFKTHQELQEANSLLRDKDGNLRPFDEFKRDVDKLGKEYNHNYLRAEYNHAVQSAQMAAKWQEFQKHKDFVNLQYRTAGDQRVRAEHAILHGTTLPVDHKFWSKYIPPLGWNCRCTVVEVLKDSYPESDSEEASRAGDSATSKPAEKIFRFNPGKDLKVFPPKHPYLPKGCGDCKYKRCINLVFDNEKDICKACRNTDKAIVKWSRERVREHFHNILGNGKKQIIIHNGEVPHISISNSNIKVLSGKAHKYPYARNMVIFYLDRLINDLSQTEYIGSSSVIKGVDVKGHTYNTKWYYYRLKFLGSFSYIIIKEFKGEYIVHHIQDSEHFDESKIKNKVSTQSSD